MNKTFRPYSLDQQLLLPPDLRDWLPEGHLALFVSDVVDTLDLSAIYASYTSGDGRGKPPYDPRMMVKLLVYGYSTGKTSSRRIERATYEEIPYRVLSANQHPDHDSIATFRKRHLEPLAGLFMQVLKLAQELGLVKLGHVALDGTKIKANASKHKAMSYGRMTEAEARLDAEIKALLEAAEQTDADEDQKQGKGRRDDDLPAELQHKQARRLKIQEARAALEQRVREEAEAEAAQVQARLAERAEQEAQTGRKSPGRAPVAPDPAQAKPLPKSQINFTDPESRIMVDGASKGFEQCYNAQAAVDSATQIIVAAEVTQQANDKEQLVPMIGQVLANMGQMPEKTSADSGYFSTEAVLAPSLSHTELYVPPNRQKHGQPPAEVDENTRVSPDSDLANQPEAKASAAHKRKETAEQMRARLATQDGRDIYKMRKAIVEPVFGQIKQALGFRRFSFRGHLAVKAEWLLVCTVHNLLKIFRSGKMPRLAAG